MSHVDEGTLHAYLDGALPPAERAALEAHIAQCETCRAQLVEERALLERSNALLGTARPVERPLPPFEQLRREPKRSPWRVRTSVAWAASLALALGLGYYLHDLRSYRMTREMPAPENVVAQNQVAEDRAAPPPPPPPRAYESRGAQPSAPARHETAERDRQKLSMGRVDSSVLKAPVRAAPRTPSPGAMASAAQAPTLDSIDAVTTQVPPAMQAGLQRQDVLAERKVSANLWPRIDRETAKTILGEDPVGLPDLTTRTYRRSPDRDGVVLVEQQLDDRTVIQIFQQQTARANARFDSLVSGARGAPIRGFDRERADRLARFVGKLRVEIGGPVSVDSLNRLLEQIGRLP